MHPSIRAEIIIDSKAAPYSGQKDLINNNPKEANKAIKSIKYKQRDRGKQRDKIIISKRVNRSFGDAERKAAVVTRRSAIKIRH